MIGVGRGTSGLTYWPTAVLVLPIEDTSRGTTGPCNVDTFSARSSRRVAAEDKVRVNVVRANFRIDGRATSSQSWRQCDSNQPLKIL
ncbi:hypothetical protein ACKS0A_06812 [Histoplasma ohiense]